MAKITLLRKSTKYDPSFGSYKMILEVTSAENISKKVFVKQRIRNFFKQNFDDVVVAVATPVQLEDFDEDSPKEGDSHFRVSTVEVIGRTPDYLDWWFDNVLADLQKLVSDVESLNELEVDGIYEITADEVDVNMAIAHTHYRLPLTAAPAGINEVYNDNGIDRHRVSSENITISGWLNADANTPTGYKFRYNIDEDPTLFALWPIPSDRISYAHIEVNGATTDQVLINNSGIYWKDDRYGQAPWPGDYVNTGDTGSPENKVVLVIDFIA